MMVHVDLRRCTLLLLIAAGFACGSRADGTGATADSEKLITDLGLHVASQPARERPGWRSPHIILVSPQLHDQLDALQELAPTVKFVELSSNTAARDIADADASLGICSADILVKAKKLQWIQWLAAGAERCVTLPIVQERKPLVTNLQRAAGGSMAEHVMGLMLVLSRKLDFYIDEQRAARWSGSSPTTPAMTDLEGKTVLVVGLGGIGTEVARRAHAFGMKVTATRASGRTGPDYVSYVGLPEELPALAKDADFVVNCLPLTPATTGIFNARFFALMRPTAYFLSVGRGRSTVTADLIAALKDKRIAGAGLDVTDPEPLPSDSPLWKLPNVVITPHVSANTPLANELRNAVVLENVKRYTAGEPMLSVVDIGKGY
ncbi:MAG TPA: D-2-hydroxyacid dehydrogenase [Steroidobacteraceae bacterium]|nr:D-2-hydroxyacid dehydrogenase [Steroidobacteraceae bacterium]